MQREFYDREWSDPRRQFANANQLTRAVAVFEEILRTGVQRPRICELGAGTGWLTSMLGSLGETTGVELSEVAVAGARRRYPHVSFECADAVGWSYAANSFDLVVSHEVLEHIVDQAAYLDTARRILKPGGWLVLTTPNAKNVRATPPAIRSAQPVENVVTRRELRRLLRPRFQHVRVRSVILGGGSKGVYRLVNSTRLHRLLDGVRLGATFRNLALGAGLGLHLVAIAQKC